MAIPTVTIQGAVLTPSGAAPVRGNVTALLTKPGSVFDGGTSQRVAAATSGTIGAGGALTGLELVPNDQIVPSGTSYHVTFQTHLPNGQSVNWTEVWQVASAPSPVDIGAVPRLDAVQGVAVTTEAAVQATVLASATASKNAAAASATAAAGSAGVADTSRVLAVAAQAAAEAARDAALVTGKVYPDATAGLAATAEGGYFSVPSAQQGESLVLYRKEAGVAVEKKRYPSSSGVQARVGRYNGWPDPFFRRLDLSSQTLLGRDRWAWNNAGAGAFDAWSRVASSAFDGYALRRAADRNTTPLNGPVVHLDELGAVAGDTITVYGLFIGNGASAYMPGRFDTGLDTNWTGGQVNPLSISGASFVTTSPTPQWLRHVVTVPAGATRFQVWPYTPTAGQTFDFVAFWAFRGDQTKGPDWPTQEEELYQRLRDADLSVAYQASVVDGAPRLDYALDLSGKVTASAEAVALAVTGVGSTAWHGDPFSGWAERYSPAGLSFNAIRVKMLLRGAYTDATRWSSLNVVIRTGANSHLAGASVVAVGSTRIAAAKDAIADVTIVLKDPTTGAVKTLTDADFAGGEYFVGVYARTATGGPAAMSDHEATQANSLGQSYYITAADPKTGAWSATSAGSNKRVGVQHLLLTAPVEGFTYSPSSALKTSIVGAVQLVLPPTIYAHQGREVSIYFDNITPSADARDLAWDASGGPSTSQQQSERWTYTPTGASDNTLTIEARDKRTGDLLASATAQVKSVAAAAGAGLTPKCIFIGDSLTNAAVYTGELVTIAAADALKIALYGTRGVAPNVHEGRPGWKIDGYTSNFSDGSGANPFWIGGAVNFHQYLANNAIPIPDWVFIELGINDCFNVTTDEALVALAATELAKLDTLIASIKAAGAGVKVALMTPTPPSAEQDAFGANYQLGQTRWRFKRNIVLWTKELLAKYAGQTAQRIYLVPTHVNLDTVNNMSRAAAAPVNSRSTVQVQRQNNGVHPATEGYYQMADSVWAFLKCNS